MSTTNQRQISIKTGWYIVQNRLSIKVSSITKAEVHCVCIFTLTVTDFQPGLLSVRQTTIRPSLSRPVLAFVFRKTPTFPQSPHLPLSRTNRRCPLGGHMPTRHTLTLSLLPNRQHGGGLHTLINETDTWRQLADNQPHCSDTVSRQRAASAGHEPQSSTLPPLVYSAV